MVGGLSKEQLSCTVQKRAHILMKVITLFEKFFLMIYWYITVPDPDLDIRAGGRGEGGGGFIHDP